MGLFFCFSIQPTDISFHHTMKVPDSNSGSNCAYPPLMSSNGIKTRLRCFLNVILTRWSDVCAWNVEFEGRSVKHTIYAIVSSHDRFKYRDCKLFRSRPSSLYLNQLVCAEHLNRKWENYSYWVSRPLQQTGKANLCQRRPIQRWSTIKLLRIPPEEWKWKQTIFSSSATLFIRSPKGNWMRKN